MIERRKSIRNRSYLGGRISFNRRRSVMDCLVRNLSPDGAKVVFDHTTTVPDEFDLTIARKERTFRARTIWRRADEMGVAFVASSTANAPIPLDLARRIRDFEAERDRLRRRVAELSTAE
jgi:PilZ domain